MVGQSLRIKEVSVISEAVLTREQIIDKLLKAIEVHEHISSFFGIRFRNQGNSAEDKWTLNRKKIAEHLKVLVNKYAFAKTLPREELGISALAILNYIVKIQHAFYQLIIMIDMIRGESFDDIYLNSLNAISLKTHQQLVSLKELTEEQKDNPDAAFESLREIMKLEREIDEDYIVIGRMLSVATEGEAGYTHSIMRKIVNELEHISDFVKRAAEIIVGI